jgi:16S rRNA (adenine1518-N6/adenine1519-N6)-dimethyltransferase
MDSQSTANRFHTKKSLGQHFLTSPVVPGWLAGAASIEVGELVIEIGPGTGVLTAVLLDRGAHVIALEADPRALVVLAKRFAAEIAAGTLTLIHTDVRELDLAALGLTDHSFKIVANIPYYLSGHLFRHCLAGKAQPSTLVFLVQKEVGKRVASDFSRGGKHSLLSLSVQVYGDVQYVRTVSRGHFSPAPQVDSGIVVVTNISRNNFAGLSEADFFRLLHLAFGQKRKQLLGNLAAEYDRDGLTDLFSSLGLSPTVRAEDVSLADWLVVAKRLLSPSTPSVTQ